MVRETRHLWVGNLPDNIREDRIREHFKRYGRVQSVKLLPRVTEEKTGEVTMACTVAFMDIKSASKAHNAELKIDDRTLNTEYYEPAAIPSSAASVAAAAAATASGVSISSSPQNNTPSPYSTSSPGTTRFPNGHGSSDEHVPFPDAGTGTTSSRFYERSSSTASQSGGGGGGGGGNTTSSNVRPPPPPEGGAPEVANRRTATTTTTSTSASYQDTGGGTTTGGGSCRGRTRDRSYRSTNGPFNAQGHRTPSTGVGWSGYESSRFNNSNAANQSETGYNSTASETNERRNSDQNVRKKAKSRSGTRSPSPSGSTSSRSPSRSRSRSSSSSSTSSTSRDTSTASSPRSRRHHQHGSSTNQSGQDDRRPVAICVKNLPLRSSDTSLKDGLFHEYKKHGKVTWVKVVGQAADRYAIVCFKKPEDADKALEVSYDKLFFGCKIEVAPYTICDVEEGDLRPYEAEIDEYHPKATRTLFIGNLEKDVTASDLRKHFDQFGEIIEIDIKKQGAVSSYAFCQYSDIVSVVKAIRKMDGEHLGNNRIKLGFGKSMAYNCVWIDGINESVNEKYLRMQFEPFGVINRCVLDRERGQALIFYEHVSHAQLAVSKMRGFVLKNSKLQVDFASRECQECFFERLEKQGLILDRTTAFEDRRDSSSRSFESSAVSRISRYDTPTRPRTSSYSSRSSVAAIQSPGTPGNMTPRGGRSRLSRYDYYDMEYIPGDRHISHRSYDEYSQGSAASHEDPYDPYDPHGAYLHDSPGHLDPLEVRVVQTLVDPVPFAPHDIRNLQKERVHLLEQLEECPSSGDELISPKKRLKLDLLDPVLTSDVIIEANRDHRKVMEVRRLSETTLRHHSRRPSVDSKYKDHVSSSGHYVPHAVGCKRRKTASDGGSSRSAISHSHYVMTVAEPSDGSENGGSRPGTPLCDEKPEFPQAEPRRTPRDREGPLTLPLPKFASQIMNRGSVSVAGIKGQKDTASILSSPPATSTSPRVSNRPPSPVHVPPPASPPPRPPSLSSNSSDSDITSPSASLEERIRSLDEKYEKWSGSRALSAAGGEALALLDANLEKFRQRHKLLDLDLNEVQPSEIVKSVMAKRSVFDEDLKRLENVGEKYEPKEFGLFNNRVASLATAATTTSPLSTPLKLAPLTQLPKTPTLLSPRSSGTATIPAAKGLQYPFPSHPPIQMSPVPTLQVASSGTVTTATSVTPTSSTSTVTVRTATLGENRLKPCASVPGDVRTSSTKVNVVRNTVVLPTLSKLSEKNNIPNASDGNATSGVLKVKSSDKTDKIMCRRDSNSSSPRADVKTRRNSDTSARRIEDEKIDIHERGKSEEQRREHRLAEKAREAQEKLEEKEKVEREKLEKETQEAERLEREYQERKERQERESELEKQRLEKEKLHKEKLEKEKERNKVEKHRLEKSRLEKERQERERIEREKVEKERHEKEKQEHEKLERERQKEQERKDREEKERIERIEKEKREAEEKEKQEKLKKEKEESEKREMEERELQVKEHTDKLEKERDRKKDEEKSRHKEDNHHDRRKDDSKHRESHSESKHRDNNIDKHAHDKSTKESCKDDKSSHELHRRDSHHENSRHDKVRYHLDREAERRKESIKENRDNNIHDKHKNLTETKEHRDRAIVETRHASIDSDKNRTCDKDPNKRKERNNSLPANLGVKRRMSSHDGVDVPEEKRIKLSHEHKKVSERRDSKDCKSEDKQRKSKHKNNSINTTHEKHNSTKENDEKRKDKEREREEKHKKHKLEKQKSKTKSREKESRESPILQTTTLTDKDFLAKLNLRSTEEVEREKQRKEHRDKRKEVTLDSEKREEKRNHEDNKKKDRISTDSKETNKSHEDVKLKTGEEKKHLKREKSRKITTSDSDSDEPKKQHSIFDIVDDEPAYISMYDKVKARSCKNMQKQEEEKRQEKIKAKFSQLKLSRARREEKKRSTSWDEDSDSGKESSEVKPRRSRKVLDSSDESEDRKSNKRREIYSDSDSSILRQIKSEPVETTDDEIKNKVGYKVCKSRITSDTSDDEYQKPKLCSQIISEDFHEKKVNSDMSKLFSENENDQGFADTDEKPEKITSVKTELERLIKKERRSSKFQEFHSTENQIFRDSHSPEREVKSEKYNKQIFDTTDDETTPETRKEKTERREKKHKKKQKKQKHYLNDEAPNKTEMDSVQGENQDRTKHHDKKKDHSRKDKKRDKTREGREKSKKSKKNKSEGKNEIKSDGKMENIFGPLSEDSENEIKIDGLLEVTSQIINKFTYLIDENAQQPHSFNTDSEKEHDSKIKEDRERDVEREEHKKRKEKKRREKERRLQEAAAEAAAAAAEEPPHSNDNSMDFIDMGKQLEANIKDDTSEIEIKSEADSMNIETNMFCFNNQNNEIKKEDRKEGREKKKKRKRSKEERSKHHHHHHHDKNKIKSPEIKKEQVAEETKELSEVKCQSQSMPTILEATSPIMEKPSPEFTISPSTKETIQIVSPIPKTPTTSKEKKPEKLLPGFGTEIDETIHENAVKSISSEFEPVVKKEEPVIKVEIKEEKLEEQVEDKPRVVISQEETEDAVAALLGESFGNGQFNERYSDEISNPADVGPTLSEENNVQDDEEMRQAVQSLSVSDLDVKPDTPQSEHELQIDTDTEEQDEPSVVESVTKSPESANINQQPKAQDIQLLETSKTSHFRTTPSISSPPSLTPIKSQPLAVIEPKKNLEELNKNMPIVPDQQQRSVISQSWVERKLENHILKQDVLPLTESKPPVQPVISQISTNPPVLKSFATPPTIKISEANYPPLAAITKLSPSLEQKIQTLPVQNTNAKSTSVSQLHNLPARSPVQICKPVGQDTILAPKASSNVNLSRLPITSMIVSKPLQTTTVLLPQPKVAHSMEPPKLVSVSSEMRTQPRMVFQTSSVPFSTFPPRQPGHMIVQGNIRHLPPTGLLVPTRHLAPGYAYMGNIPHSTYNNVPVSKELHPHSTDKKQQEDIKISPTVSTCLANNPIKPTIIMSGNTSSLPTISTTKAPVTTGSISHQIILTCSKPNPSTVPVTSRPAVTISQSAPHQSPKSVSVINEPQVSVGASTSERPNSSVMLQVSPKSSVPELSSIKPLQELDQLSIPITEIPKTSNPSPVIVSNPLSSESNSECKPASPIKLAIEKVTEELNNSLTKEMEEEKEEIVEAIKTEGKADSTAEKSQHVVKQEESVEPKELNPKVKESNPQEKLEAAIDSKDNIVTEDTSTNLFKATASFEEKDISKEDSLDIKEDNDYWSAKEVNIDSVIKTLCSADEMSDHGSESGKYKEPDSKHIEAKHEESTEPITTILNKSDEASTETKSVEEKAVTTEHEDEPRTPSTRSVTRGRGRGGRRAKGKTVVERGGIQTRQGKLKEMSNVSATPTKRGRGGRTRSDRTALKSESDSTDVYEFKEESEESNKEQRPRLVLTIKSTASSTNNSQPTAIVKEITKDGTKEIGKEVKESQKETSSTKQTLEQKEEFTSPQSNTRKSRRLAEKDISKNTVDDIIEDVVKNAPQTRASSNQRRSGRQVVNKSQTPTLLQLETPRKSPRGRKPRRASEATENSSSEEMSKDEGPKSMELPPTRSPAAEKLKEPDLDISKQVEQVKEKPFEGLKAAMLRRIKGELSNSARSEPTNLIDPVTGLLIPMRESEEGKYIPLPGSTSGNEQKVMLIKPSTPPNQPEPVKEEVKGSELVKTPQSVITQPQPIAVVQQQMPKIHPFTAHVLSSQVTKAVISHQLVQTKPTTTTALSQSQQQQHVISKPITPIVQNKSIPVSQNVHIVAASIASSSSPMSPRPAMPVVATKVQVKPPVLSPSQQILLTSQKQFIQVNKQPPSLQVPKAHISAAVSQQAQIVNTQIAHMKQPLKQPQVIIGKGSITKPPHPMHQQQILTGQVASPPLSKSQAPVGTAARIIQGPSSAANKGVMEPPKIDVNLPNMILGRPNLSPQGSQARLPGLPVPGYEASLGEPITHFPPGPLRPPPDLNPAHYMHPAHVVQYHQFLRQQQLQHLQRSSVLEKSGEEGEEAPVGLALGGRGAAVPHSLHSPHDRATESPQMGQVYNTLSHTARLTPYHPNNRYFDQAEPPPAHRPLTSHSSLAALPGDRGIAHMAPLSTPDRSLSSHLQADRPLSSHSSAHMGSMSATERMAAHIERPHGVMGAGLGAAGNLMGAVAKHIGADAPTSQRGLQAATPPHASQVPPQAESLFMLLKHYPLRWQGLLALKNDQAAVQMYSVSGNDDVAKCSLPKNTDGSTPPLRIFQRMRLEPPQVEGVARKMQTENEHCMLLALPCGHDHMDVLKQSTNLTNGFITYLQQKQAAGIVNVAAPGTTEPPAYVIHIFPSCDFVNQNLRRIAPSLLERVADIAHLLIVITTV